MRLLGALVVWSLPAWAQVVAGSYVGDGTAGRFVDTRVTPTWVLVKGEAGPINEPAMMRTATMTGDASKRLAGTTVTPMAPDGITSIDDGGFRVGTRPEVNAAGHRYWFVAGLAGVSSVVGKYTGDGTADRQVPIGFAPDWVLLLPDSNDEPVFALDAPDSGLNHVFHGREGVAPAGFLALESGGFRVTSLASSNASGTAYHYVAVRKKPELAAIGTYVGDGARFRSVLGLGLYPQWVFVSLPETNAVHGFAGRPGHVELTLTGAGPSSAGLVPVPGGFETDGGTGRVNINNREYAFVALGGASVLEDGGVLGDPSVLEVPRAAPKHYGVGCACGAGGGGPLLLLILLGMSERRRQRVLTRSVGTNRCRARVRRCCRCSSVGRAPDL